MKTAVAVFAAAVSFGIAIAFPAFIPDVVLFTENFDSLKPGPLAGQGGWVVRWGEPGTAVVQGDRALGAGQALEIAPPEGVPAGTAPPLQMFHAIPAKSRGEFRFHMLVPGPDTNGALVLGGTEARQLPAAGVAPGSLGAPNGSNFSAGTAGENSRFFDTGVPVVYGAWTEFRLALHPDATFDVHIGGAPALRGRPSTTRFADHVLLTGSAVLFDDITYTGPPFEVGLEIRLAAAGLVTVMAVGPAAFRAVRAKRGAR